MKPVVVALLLMSSTLNSADKRGDAAISAGLIAADEAQIKPSVNFS